jgi:serine/threonine-protein kinase
VLHQVGVGALGPVFRTYEPTRDRLVAVKVFRLDIVPEQAQALADALSHASEAGLFHPSIVEPIASGVEGSVAYRAEEYVAAESLDVAMRHYAPAPVEKALPFVTQLAGAIDFARAAGIGHGGLHPRDIFITPDDARATGFGVVEALEKVGIRAPVRRPYSAPERIEGQPWGVAADVFALAAITFELLTARRPAGIGKEAGSLPEMPNRQAVQNVLARAMDQDPARRYATALAFAAALEAAWRGEATEEAAPPAVAIPATTEHDNDQVEPTLRQEAPGELPEPTLFDHTADDDVEPTLRHHPSAYEATIPVPVISAQTSAASSTENEFSDEDHDGATMALHTSPPAGTDRFADGFADEEPAIEHHSHESDDDDATGPYAHGHAALDLHDHAPAAAVLEEPRGHSLGSYIAVAIFGLILGFAAAYFMWGRNAVPAAVEADSGSPASQPASSAQSGSSTDNPKPAATAAAQPSRSAAPPAAAAAAPAATRASAPPPPPAPTRGAITVRSTPSRAGVTVNGKWRGRTPLTLDSLPFGKYVVRVVQPDYKASRDEVALDARTPSRTLDVKLESATPPAAPSRGRASRQEAPRTQETFTGALFVDSHPQGATVVIDGKPMGKTPLRLNAMAIGTHVVRLELAKHRPWYSTARVVAGQELRVAGSLEEIQ